MFCYRWGWYASHTVRRCQLFCEFNYFIIILSMHTWLEDVNLCVEVSLQCLNLDVHVMFWACWTSLLASFVKHLISMNVFCGQDQSTIIPGYMICDTLWGLQTIFRLYEYLWHSILLQQGTISGRSGQYFLNVNTACTSTDWSLTESLPANGSLLPKVSLQTYRSIEQSLISHWFNHMRLQHWINA
jgi:hypothetical protein